MEPIICPFCGGSNLAEDNEMELELDDEFWSIYHWRCLDCYESFDKIVTAPKREFFEEEHWS
ncbi:MAG: hypothetical protein AB1488_01340 [Nitrospirota bacterium]